MMNCHNPVIDLCQNQRVVRCGLWRCNRNRKSKNFKFDFEIDFDASYLWFFYFSWIFTGHISLCFDSDIVVYLYCDIFHHLCLLGFLVSFSKWNTDLVQEQWMEIFFECLATSNKISSLPLIFASKSSWIAKMLLQLQPQVVEYLLSK